jgi:hypothetical protein
MDDRSGDDEHPPVDHPGPLGEIGPVGGVDTAFERSLLNLLRISHGGTLLFSIYHIEEKCDMIVDH